MQPPALLFVEVVSAAGEHLVERHQLDGLAVCPATSPSGPFLVVLGVEARRELCPVHLGAVALVLPAAVGLLKVPSASLA